MIGWTFFEYKQSMAFIGSPSTLLQLCLFCHLLPKVKQGYIDADVRMVRVGAPMPPSDVHKYTSALLSHKKVLLLSEQTFALSDKYWNTTKGTDQSIDHDLNRYLLYIDLLVY